MIEVTLHRFSLLPRAPPHIDSMSPNKDSTRIGVILHGSTETLLGGRKGRVGGRRGGGMGRGSHCEVCLFRRVVHDGHNKVVVVTAGEELVRPKCSTTSVCSPPPPPSHPHRWLTPLSPLQIPLIISRLEIQNSFPGHSRVTITAALEWAWITAPAPI